MAILCPAPNPTNFASRGLEKALFSTLSSKSGSIGKLKWNRVAPRVRKRCLINNTNLVIMKGVATLMQSDQNRILQQERKEFALEEECWTLMEVWWWFVNENYHVIEINKSSLRHTPEGVRTCITTLRPHSSSPSPTRLKQTKEGPTVIVSQNKKLDTTSESSSSSSSSPPPWASRSQLQIATYHILKQ